MMHCGHGGATLPAMPTPGRYSDPSASCLVEPDHGEEDSRSRRRLRLSPKPRQRLEERRPDDYRLGIASPSSWSRRCTVYPPAAAATSPSSHELRRSTARPPSAWLAPIVERAFRYARSWRPTNQDPRKGTRRVSRTDPRPAQFTEPVHLPLNLTGAPGTGNHTKKRLLVRSTHWATACAYQKSPACSTQPMRACNSERRRPGSLNLQ